MFSPAENVNFLSRYKFLLIIAVIFFIVLLAGAGSVYAYDKYYENKIFPGVKIGNLDLGGKSLEEARTLITGQTNLINQNGIVIKRNQAEFTLMPTVPSMSGDFAKQLITFDPDATANKTLGVGRNSNQLSNLETRLHALIFGEKLISDFDINESETLAIIEENFKNLIIPAQNAQLIPTEQNGSFTFAVSDEKLGVRLNYQQGLQDLKEKISNLSFSPLELHSETDYPQIYKAESFNAPAEAQEILKKAPLTLESGDKRWIISTSTLANWLGLEKNNDQSITVGLNKKVVNSYFEENISSELDQEPQEPRFKMSQGRVSEFQVSKDGYKVDVDKTIEMIQKNFLSGDQNIIEILGDKVKSQLKISSQNNLGIKEIIGTGQSNFAGSPANRRSNIRTGSKSISGIIIKPDEEFSLVDALGEVDDAAGYLPELVIKGDKTVPEYGGGLCQVATTIFRAALAAGLPITERRNHSYRVSYYEPAGMDAAVYIPQPDVKFLNDTGNNILIQYRIDGDNLYFDFWGQKDGRNATTTTPVIYNIVRPAPSKIIETLNLKPGEKKCTERAHNGADAYFDYTVNYSDGEIKEKKFTSHYIPWQEVCLVGVEELTASSTPANATSTPETISTPATTTSSSTQTN